MSLNQIGNDDMVLLILPLRNIPLRHRDANRAIKVNLLMSELIGIVLVYLIDGWEGH